MLLLFWLINPLPHIILFLSFRYPSNRITKDVVAFHAGDFNELVEKLQLDLHEPPVSQVIKKIFSYLPLTLK